MKEDLKQYITNLLYYAHVEAMSMHSIDFDKWVEEHVDLIDQYFKDEESTREVLSQFYVYLVGQGKFIETNPFDSYKDADNFIKTL